MIFSKVPPLSVFFVLICNGTLQASVPASSGATASGSFKADQSSAFEKQLEEISKREAACRLRYPVKKATEEQRDAFALEMHNITCDRFRVHFKICPQQMLRLIFKPEGFEVELRNDPMSAVIEKCGSAEQNIVKAAINHAFKLNSEKDLQRSKNLTEAKEKIAKEVLKEMGI